jgi:hypothetical protein
MGLGLRYQAAVMAEESARALLEQMRRNDSAAQAGQASKNAAFELLVAELMNAEKALHDLPQGEARRERKKTLLSQYLPFVETFLAGEENFQNPVLMWCLVWSVDIGDMATAQRLATAAIERNQVMPRPPFKEGYSVKTFWADAVIVWANEEFAFGRSVNPYFPDVMVQALEWPVHDIIKSRYHKLAALIDRKNGALDSALKHAKRAQEIAGPDAKVKTLVAELEKAVAAKAGSEQKDSLAPGTGNDSNE